MFVSKYLYIFCSGIVRELDFHQRLMYISSRVISLDDIHSIQAGDQTA